MLDLRFCGSPQTVTERLLNIVKIFRIGHLMFLPQFGSLSHDKTYGEHRTPGRRVLPHLRPIWESEGWKDRATRSCPFSAARWRLLSISQAWAGRCTTCTPPGRPNDIDQIDNLWDVVVAKMIWPIPDKGQNKRIHRIIAPSLNVWGENGRLIPPVYAHTFRKAINNAEMWSRTAARTMRGIDCARAGIPWRARSGWRRAS